MVVPKGASSTASAGSIAPPVPIGKFRGLGVAVAPQPARPDLSLCAGACQKAAENKCAGAAPKVGAAPGAAHRTAHGAGPARPRLFVYTISASRARAPAAAGPWSGRSSYGAAPRPCCVRRHGWRGKIGAASLAQDWRVGMWNFFRQSSTFRGGRRDGTGRRAAPRTPASRQPAGGRYKHHRRLEPRDLTANENCPVLSPGKIHSPDLPLI